MPKIQVQFSTQSTIPSAIIRWRDWSDYSHVELIMPDGKLLGANLDGVKLRDPYKVAKRLILEIEVTEEQANRIYLNAMMQIGKKYDWAGIFGFVASRNWQETDKWFCSELIAWLFLKAGIKLLRTDDIHRISPHLLSLSPHWKESTI